MILKLFTEADKQRYSDFVRQNGGSFVQYIEWGDFQASLGKKVSRYIVEIAGDVVATAQVVLNSAAGKDYLSISYGPVLSDPDPQVILFLMEELSKLYPSAVFIRIEPQLDPEHLSISSVSSRIKKTIDLNPHQTLILDISKSTEEILDQMHPKTRYNIRLAQKKDLEIRVRDNIGDAGQLFLKTADRQGFKSFSESYYKKMLEYFRDNDQGVSVKLYAAYHDTDLLAANIMVFANQSATYLFGASSEVKRNFMAPYLLHYTAIQDAKNKGLSQYDFWGIEQDPKHPWHGFSKFKLGFGGQLFRYCGTWDYVIKPAWYNGYTVMRGINRVFNRRFKR
jgi:lipid II:glycine glycyltransferase (peptidoglycan interpeptide bridge formation enzyme)